MHGEPPTRRNKVCDQAAAPEIHLFFLSGILCANQEFLSFFLSHRLTREGRRRHRATMCSLGSRVSPSQGVTHPPPQPPRYGRGLGASGRYGPPYGVGKDRKLGKPGANTNRPQPEEAEWPTSLTTYGFLAPPVTTKGQPPQAKANSRRGSDGRQSPCDCADVQKRTGENSVAPS